MLPSGLSRDITPLFRNIQVLAKRQGEGLSRRKFYLFTGKRSPKVVEVR